MLYSRLFEPADEFVALFGRDARGLMREVRCDVAISEDSLPCASASVSSQFRFEAIAGIEQRRETRIDRIERAEFPFRNCPTIDPNHD